jgi:hypothetical protein
MSRTITYPSELFVGQLFFKDSFTGLGWSEKYWLNASGYDSAMTKLTAIRTARVALFSTQVSVIYSRVSNPSVKGDAKIVGGTIESVPGTLTATDQSHPSLCLLIRQEDAVGKHANRYLHAVPEEIQTAGVYDPDSLAGWAAKIEAYDTAVTSNSVLLHVPRGDVVTATSSAIESMITIRVSNKKVGRPFDLVRARS